MPQIVKMPSAPSLAVVLGAGFSRSLAEEMPLTNELGAEVVRRAQETMPTLNAPQFENDRLTFESWFSWLADRQPYQTEAQYHARQSEFYEVQSRIAEVIRERQEGAQERDVPRWLTQWLEMLHAQQATVMTLNYDTLFESLFGRLLLTDDTGEVSFRTDIEKIFPSRQGVLFGDGPLRANNTLDLLKLHGSTDWYWVPGDSTGATFELVQVPAHQTPAQQKSLIASIGGKVEFIVPPTTSKTSFFTNSKTRYLWQAAASALERANEVVLVGYSLPLADAAMASMLATTAIQSSSTFTIVNPNCADVSERLQSLGVHPSRIRQFGGDTCLLDYSLSRVHDAAAAFASIVRDESAPPPTDYMAVGWSAENLGQVTDAAYDEAGGVLTLAADCAGGFRSLHRPGTPDESGDIRSAVLTWADVTNRIPDGVWPKAFCVEIGDGQPWEICGFVENMPGLEDVPDWTIFRPLGQVSRP